MENKRIILTEKDQFISCAQHRIMEYQINKMEFEKAIKTCDKHGYKYKILQSKDIKK